MHVMLLGDVLALAFCLFAAFAGIFVASFAAALSSAPSLSMGDESDLVIQLQETRARLARISYEENYARVMREAGEDESAEAENVCGESAANVSAPLPPRGLVRPPTAEMRRAWAASLDAPDTGFPLIIAGVMPTRAYSPFPPVEWEPGKVDDNFIGGQTFALPKSTRLVTVGVN